MLLYLFASGLSFTKYKFHFGIFIFIFLSVIFLYSFYSPLLQASLIHATKALLWTLAAVCAYRLRLFGKLKDPLIFKVICIAIPIGCTSSLYVKFFGELHTSQNVGTYGLIWLLPLLILCAGKSRIIKTIMIGMVFLTLLLALKRGAIIAFFAGTLLYLFVDYNSQKDLESKLKYIVFFSILIFIGGVTVYLFRESLHQRFFEAPTHRDIFYALLYKNWIAANIKNFIFGFGSLSVVTYTAHYFGSEGLVAHSDWLQLTHDYGLIGIGLLLFLYYSLLYLFFSCKKHDLFLAKIVSFAFGVMVFVNIYSGQLFTPNTLLFGMLIGIISADLNRIKARNYESTK